MVNDLYSLCVMTCIKGQGLEQRRFTIRVQPFTRAKELGFALSHGPSRTGVGNLPPMIHSYVARQVPRRNINIDEY